MENKALDGTYIELKELFIANYRESRAEFAEELEDIIEAERARLRAAVEGMHVFLDEVQLQEQFIIDYTEGYNRALEAVEKLLSDEAEETQASAVTTYFACMVCGREKKTREEDCICKAHWKESQ